MASLLGNHSNFKTQGTFSPSFRNTFHKKKNQFCKFLPKLLAGVRVLERKRRTRRSTLAFLGGWEEARWPQTLVPNDGEKDLVPRCPSSGGLAAPSGHNSGSKNPQCLVHACDARPAEKHICTSC